MFKSLRLMSVLFVLVAAGCVTTSNEPEVAPFAIAISGDFDFMPNEAKTFAWHPKSGNAHVDENYDIKNIVAEIEQAIELEMVQKGYTRVSISQKPDFYLGFGVATESELSDQEVFKATLLSTGINTDSADESVQTGSIFIGLYDATTNTLRWRALAQGASSPETKEEDRRSHDYVTRMLRSIPEVTPSFE